MLAIILIALSITSFISVITGLGFFLLGKGFFVPFLFTLAGINALGYLHNTFLIRKSEYNIAREKMLMGYDESQAITKITCAYCGTTNNVRIFLGKSSNFKCTHCSSDNSVVIALNAARMTKPISNDVETQKILDKIVEIQMPTIKETSANKPIVISGGN